jgi:type II secretory pathway pseudopilin PulG
MFGVLAILAILAGILISNATRRLDLAALSSENANLAAYSTALQNSILRNGYIPGTNNWDWAVVIATELGVDTASVTTNSRNLQRCFLIDPALQIGTNAAGVLPYSQTNTIPVLAAGGLIAQPSSPRLMLVSTMGTPLPSFIASGTVSSAVFTNLWNWTDQSPTPPAGWPASWNNRGTDLVVQRLNLGPLFVHLSLQNYPPQPNFAQQGRYAIDGLVTNVPFLGLDAYLVKSTLLGLLQEGAAGPLQAEQILTRDATFFYVQQVWRGTINFGQDIANSPPHDVAIGSEFAATAAAFNSSPYNINSPATPKGVLYNITNFMNTYSLWATSGFTGVIGFSVTNAETSMTNYLMLLTNNLTPGGCTNPP